MQLRATGASVVQHAATSDHCIDVHAGSPVRVTCSANTRSIRTRGDLCLMPAGRSEEWIEDDASEAVALRLPDLLLRLAAEEMGLDPDRACLEPRHDFRDPQIEHITWALEAELRADFPSGLLYRESLGIALAIHLLAHYRGRAQARGTTGLAVPVLRRVTDYIEAHLDRDLSVVRLARVAGASTSHFKTLFRRSVGVPVHEYVIQRRVERARALLLRGDRPPMEVALDAGFSHQSHMARCMRRVLGVTPRSLVRSRT